jgi:hypothetical protein
MEEIFDPNTSPSKFFTKFNVP